MSGGSGQTHSQQTMSVEAPSEPSENRSDQHLYRDPEWLQAAYTESNAYDDIVAQLDVDVTPQTLRRYLIKYGITASSAAKKNSETESAHTVPGKNNRADTVADGIGKQVDRHSKAFADSQTHSGHSGQPAAESDSETSWIKMNHWPSERDGCYRGRYDSSCLLCKLRLFLAPLRRLM